MRRVSIPGVRAVLWLRIAAATTVAAALLCALSPAHPGGQLAWPLQPAAGAASGWALALLVTRRRPRRPARLVPRPIAAARVALLGLLATDEEILWRRTVLGELLVAGPAAALAASAAAFALAHRARPGLHLGTGAVLGGLYVATGGLAVSIGAHWAYNVLLGAPSSRAGQGAGGEDAP